ncbi:MAG: hypothetical protein NTZ03_03440 [Actinobacteria bacterium]|nr:hypothetical protein [Actinomycetota bacterium]
MLAVGQELAFGGPESRHPADITSVLDMGVDGLISDYPDRAVDIARSSTRTTVSRAVAVGLGIVGLLLIVVGIAGRTSRRRL